MKPIHLQETYSKRSETKDERVFNGDDPKENKAFFTALKADEKERIESNKQSIDFFEKTLYKYSEILTCEVKSKKNANELKVLVLDRLLTLQEFKTNDEFAKEYDRLILFAETLISKIDAKIIDLPTTELKEKKGVAGSIGRPKVEVKEAIYYLHSKAILQFLKDKYSNTSKKKFNHVILALKELKQLKEATNKELKEAFSKELNVTQSQTNFDNAMKFSPDPELISTIKHEIEANI